MARLRATLAGLLAYGQADAEDHPACAHDVHVEKLIQPDAELDRVLQALPSAPVIFTQYILLVTHQQGGCDGATSSRRQMQRLRHM